MGNIRIKFEYEAKKDITKIRIFSDKKLIDVIEMNGNISSYTKNRVKKSLLKQYREIENENS